jgi:hypothetical protein
VKGAQLKKQQPQMHWKGLFQQKLQVGTREMIREMTKARHAEKVELETRIDLLKKQLAVAELGVQLRDKRTPIKLEV